MVCILPGINQYFQVLYTRRTLLTEQILFQVKYLLYYM